MEILEDGEVTEDGVDLLAARVAREVDTYGKVTCKAEDWVSHYWIGRLRGEPFIYLGTPDTFTVWQKTVLN